MTTAELELRLRLLTGPLTTLYGTLASIGSVRHEIITHDRRFVFVRARDGPYRLELRC